MQLNFYIRINLLFGGGIDTGTVVNSRRALCELSHTRCGCPEMTKVPLSHKYETGSSMRGANPLPNNLF